MISETLIYLGYNSMFSHKRGVENVIDFQSKSSPFKTNYYLHWDSKNRVSRYNNLICVGIKKNIFWWFTLNLLVYKIKKKKKNIFIHSHNPLMSLISFFNSNLFTVHDALYYNSNVKKHKLKYIFYFLEILLYRRTNFVHFISNFALQKSLFKAKNSLCIIPNTSHLEDYISKKKNKLEKKVIYNNYDKKIFIVKSIEERALINLIINVAEKLKNEKIKFIIAGKGPLLEFYRDLIMKLGLNNIYLVGYLSNDYLIKHYEECDLVINSAAYGEGFGLPIIESYLFNKPVIASNVCAIPDVIISKDFLFENNVNDLITVLKNTLSKDELNYRKYYDEHFSNKVVLSQFNKLYTDLT